MGGMGAHAHMEAVSSMGYPLVLVVVLPSLGDEVELLPLHSMGCAAAAGKSLVEADSALVADGAVVVGQEHGSWVAKLACTTQVVYVEKMGEGNTSMEIPQRQPMVYAHEDCSEHGLPLGRQSVVEEGLP